MSLEQGLITHFDEYTYDHQSGNVCDFYVSTLEYVFMPLTVQRANFVLPTKKIAQIRVALHQRVYRPIEVRLKVVGGSNPGGRMGLLDRCQELFKTSNLYEVLGVKKEASEADIRKGYYKVSMKVHPDRAPDDPQATEKFQVSVPSHMSQGP